ncbi:unknown [Feldmannia species virus]|uniref:Uncharacterized protein n=1 Tax=Feldmannia species virus TaxID=39420 RepID=B5LWK7_9PHYC|nr:hypothetical protein FeldSpV_gp118 [Feldmannia species virus]ACH46870.1 unknown [Feldmannia species virus]
MSLVRGVVRGGLFGFVGGLILGAAGSLSSNSESAEVELVWTNREGRTVRFTHLGSIPSLRDDLYTVFHHREFKRDAFNEAFRNIQNVISVYHPVKEAAVANMMSATKMTNFGVRASKALGAMHDEILAKDPMKAAAFEKAMMSIQLSLEESIDFVRLKSKKSLPSAS